MTARLALAVLLSGALLAPAPARASDGVDGCSGASSAQTMETLLVETFALELRATRPRYAPGDVARVRIAVTRPSGADPLGPGELVDPPAGVPAAGVEVGLGVSIGREYVYGYGVTDDAGVTTAKVRIPPDAPSKPAHVRALASKRHVNTICATVDEVGFASEPRLFVVR